MAKKRCFGCGTELGALDTKVWVWTSKEYLCVSCNEILKKHSVDRTCARREVMEDVFKTGGERFRELLEFQHTFEVTGIAKFNDNEKKIMLGSGNRPEANYLFNYDQIIGYEILDNGGAIASGGVGGAIVGGVLLGAVGAIAGSQVKKVKDVCTSLDIKVTISEWEKPAFFINLVDCEIDRKSITYKEKIKKAQEFASKIDIILEERNKEATKGSEQSSVMDSDRAVAEIRKFKQLFDEGMLTEEEFTAKKKLILGI